MKTHGVLRKMYGWCDSPHMKVVMHKILLSIETVDSERGFIQRIFSQWEDKEPTVKPKTKKTDLSLTKESLMVQIFAESAWNM